MRHKAFFRDLLYTFIISIGTIFIIVYFLPRDSKFHYQFDLNKPWRYGQLIATFNFPIYKDEAIVKKEQDSMRIHFQPYFILKKDIERNELLHLFDIIGNKDIPGSYKTYIKLQLVKVYASGVISNEDMNWLQKHQTLSVYVINDKIANEQAVTTLYTIKSAYQYLLQDTLHYDRNILQRCDLSNFLVPNISMDKKRTSQAQQEMFDNYSWATGYVQSGQKIIDRGEIISQQTYNILESLKKESIKRNETTSQKKMILLGQIIFVSILILCFILYLKLFRKDFFNKKNKLTLMLSSVIFFCIITALLVKNNLFSVYIIPYAMIPIIVRIFLDSRTAFLTLLVTIFICSITLRYPYEFILLQLTAGLIAMYSLSELSQRSQLLRVAFWVTITYIATFFAIELITENDISKFNVSMYRYFIINGVFLLFTYPLLFLLEKAFGFTSNVTLVELSNTNNHLLRRMSELAPGTFQHSIQVANLASAAANEIGADSQLVRTGALYHDIGKIENPTFFTENQSGETNPHQDLSYEQSAQIVISHVTDGLKLAEKFNLPTSIKDFIGTHHGCGKTKFFYISWMNDNPGKEPDMKEFTYPGPNPFSKETAILMMADSVEAASHSISEHTDETISTLVDNIIDEQVSDGAFENCPITFRDITDIKAIFKEKLRTIYHVRISYPKLRQ
jgi:putative nucleotidyltransferase with HDIG domain